MTTTTPTAVAPPCSYAYTENAVAYAQSPIIDPANPSWTRLRPGFRKTSRSDRLASASFSLSDPMHPKRMRTRCLLPEHEKTRRFQRVFRADDGIRTHDLLHGKQTL